MQGEKLPITSTLEKSSVDIPMSSAGITMDPFVSGSVHFTVHLWLTSVADIRTVTTGWTAQAGRWPVDMCAPI